MRDKTVLRFARAFFVAATKESTDDDDILPQVWSPASPFQDLCALIFILFQEDSEDGKFSVFHVFCELFPEFSTVQGVSGLCWVQSYSV
jgi:hypothetical protein